MDYIRIYEGNEQGTREEVLTKKQILIGRGHTITDITINHDTVSRSHAFLKLENDHWFIEDANSRSGTYVDGKRISKQTLLKHGSTIQLGEATIEFRTGSCEGSGEFTHPERLNPLEKKMAISFRPLPKAVRIICRLLDLTPDQVFRTGDTLLVGSGGIAIPSENPLPQGSVIEVSLVTPNMPPKSFTGEVLAILNYHTTPEMCVKLHTMAKDNYFRPLVEECKKGQWHVYQKGSEHLPTRAPRSNLS